MTVLVVGSTGSIGSRVVEELLAAGEHVRALVRNDARAGALPVGADGVVADLGDAPAVVRATEGADRVVLIAANSPEQEQQEGNVIDAARTHGVRHLVKLSVGGAAPDAGLALARAHWAAEQRLRASGVPATTVRPGFFMQNLLQYADWIDDDGSWRLPMGDSPIAMVDASDVAAVIAATVLGDPGGSDPVVTGGTAITMQDAAEALGTAAGRRITYVDGDPDEYRRHMVLDGHDEQYAEDMTVLYDQVIRAGYAGAVTDDVVRILGRGPRTFDQFAAANADAFR